MPLKCNLKHVLIDVKMTQKRLSELTGLSRTTITLIANGHVQPQLETALIISEALERPVNQIWEVIKPTP